MLETDEVRGMASAFILYRGYKSGCIQKNAKFKDCCTCQSVCIIVRVSEMCAFVIGNNECSDRVVMDKLESEFLSNYSETSHVR